MDSLPGRQQGCLPVPPLALDLLQRMDCSHLQPTPLTAGSDRSCATQGAAGSAPPSARLSGRDGLRAQLLHCQEEVNVNDCEGQDAPWRCAAARGADADAEECSAARRRHAPAAADTDDASNNDVTMEDADDPETPRGGPDAGFGSPRRQQPWGSPSAAPASASAAPASSFRTPLGAPRVSPHSPMSPSMMSPLRMVGARSPCSVRLCGSVRLAAGEVLPLPPAPAAASPVAGGRPGVQRVLPFTRAFSSSPPAKVRCWRVRAACCATSPPTPTPPHTHTPTRRRRQALTLLAACCSCLRVQVRTRADRHPQALPSHRFRELSFSDLLPGGGGLAAALPPSAALPPRAPRSAPASPLGAAAPRAGDPCLTPRKRARKSAAPERAASGADFEPPAGLQGGAAWQPSRQTAPRGMDEDQPGAFSPI
jgi:hypothetical protein